MQTSCDDPLSLASSSVQANVPQVETLTPEAPFSLPGSWSLSLRNSVLQFYDVNEYPYLGQLCLLVCCIIEKAGFRRES